MGDELSMDLIMTGDEAEDLFLNNSPEEKETTVPPAEGQNKTTTEGEPEPIEDINPEELFSSEGVGSGETQENGENAGNQQGDGSSPNDNFYSSIFSMGH